jgi:choline dehydrogenase-like flavoprotein
MTTPAISGDHNRASEANAYDYDVVVVGSGFGGAVSALRLSEKGYHVAVLEAGRRFTTADLPKNSWDLRNYLWAPALGLFGIQRIHLLRNVLVLAGAGVGGGSLNYAPTTASALARQLPVSRQGILKHLVVLRESGLAVAERSGRELWFRVRTESLLATASWMTGLAATWDERLAALKREAERP